MDMDLVNFLVDELSGDSEYVDTVGAAAGSAVACRDAPEWARHGQFSQLDDDRESAVDAKSDDTQDSEVEGGEDGREVGDSTDRDDDHGGDVDVGEEESLGWWAAPVVGHRHNEQVLEEEKDERRRICTSTAATDRVEEAKERDRRFWETCLASGYP